MDVLSDAVTIMRTGRPHSNRNRLRAPWGLRFPPTDGAGFHIVLSGACWLLPPDAEPLRLAAGDMVLLLREPGHALADDPGRPLAEFRAGGRDDEPRADAGPVTELFCGAYVLDRSRPHPLLADLPGIIHGQRRAAGDPRRARGTVDGARARRAGRAVPDGVRPAVHRARRLPASRAARAPAGAPSRLTYWTNMLPYCSVPGGARCPWPVNTNTPSKLSLT